MALQHRLDLRALVLAGLGISRLANALAWLRKHIRTVNVVGGSLLIIVGVLIANFVVDIAYAWIDPRIRLA